MSFATLEDAFRWVGRLTDYERAVPLDRGGMPRDLGPIRRLLHALGDPQRAFRALQVAGTNGKGSCAGMAAEILRGVDPPVGLYVSPHLEWIGERIVVEGSCLGRGELLDLLNRIVPHVPARDPGRGPGVPTFFDLMTAAAFLHFRDRGVRWGVVEVGLGGRLDSTNVLASEAGILASVALDHTGVLGGTLREIAREKLGILEPGMVFSCNPGGDRCVLDAVDAACRRTGVDCLALGREIRVAGRQGAGGFEVVCRGKRYAGLRLEVLGRHQARNAALVVAVLDGLRRRGVLGVEAAQIRAGLARFRLPARIERLSRDPPVILDGAHNPAAARALRETLDREFPGRPGVFVLAVAGDKDWRGVLRELLRPGDEAICTVIRNPRFLAAEVLARGAARLGIASRAAPDPMEAMRAALESAGRGKYVCAAGSFYLAGELRGAARV